MTAEPGAPDRTESDRLEALFLAAYQPMLRVARLMLGNVPAAEDVVMDAFERVRPRIDEPTCPRPTCARPW